MNIKITKAKLVILPCLTFSIKYKFIKIIYIYNGNTEMVQY